MISLQMAPPDSEPMIGGKTESEILAMTYKKRHRWYKTISSEEKEEARALVDAVSYAKASATLTGRKRGPMSNEQKKKISAAMTGERNPCYGRTGKKHPQFGKRGKDAAFYGRTHTKEERARISAHVSGENHPQYGKTWTDEQKRKISLYWTPEQRARFGAANSGENAPFFGKKHSKETREEMIKTRGGENHPMWRGGLSFLPYCQAFNNEVKEAARNRGNRTCTICGVSELQHISKTGKWLGRLDVDHIDSLKGQGCNEIQWKLTALCKRCHSKMQNQEVPYHSLLQLLLLNNKRHQTNFMFGVGTMNDTYENFRTRVPSLSQIGGRR